MSEDTENSGATNRDQSLNMSEDTENSGATNKEQSLNMSEDTENSGATNREQSLNMSEDTENSGATNKEQSLNKSEDTENSGATNKEQSLNMSEDTKNSGATNKEQSLNKSEDTENSGATNKEQSLNMSENTKNSSATNKEQSLNMSQDTENSGATNKEQSLNMSEDTENSGATTKEQSLNMSEDTDNSGATNKEQSLNMGEDTEKNGATNKKTHLYVSEDTKNSGATNKEQSLNMSEDTENSGATNKEQSLNMSEDTDNSGATNKEQSLNMSEDTENSGATNKKTHLYVNEDTENSGATNKEQSLNMSEDTENSGATNKEQSLNMNRDTDNSGATNREQSLNMSEETENSGATNKEQSLNMSEDTENSGTTNKKQSLKKSEDTENSGATNKEQSLKMSEGTENSGATNKEQSLNMSEDTENSGATNKEQSLNMSEDTENSGATNKEQSLNMSEDTENSGATNKEQSLNMSEDTKNSGATNKEQSLNMSENTENSGATNKEQSLNMSEDTENSGATNKEQSLNMSEDTDNNGATNKEQKHSFQGNWGKAVDIVKVLYTDLFSRTYAVPPVYFNKVPYVRKSVPGTDLTAHMIDATPGDKPPAHDPLPSSPRSELPPVPQSMWAEGSETPVRVRESDFRDDFAQNHVMLNLKNLGDCLKEVMFILSQLSFGNYLDKPAYAAAAAQLPRPSQLDTAKTKYSDGEVDFLLIHREKGILIGELKSVGRNQLYTKKEVEADVTIRKRVEQAIKQLQRSDIVIRHLLSDISSDLTVRKALFLPYISSNQLRTILSTDPKLQKEVCASLGAADEKEASQLCCCADQLSDPDTYSEKIPEVSDKLTNWWQQRMVPSKNPQLNDQQYADVVARFVGPATTVSVHCNLPPRVEVRTKWQAIAELGWRLARLILTMQQLDLMNRNPRLVCITGPPGTGKTVVLVLQALRWLLKGNDVHVVSTRLSSWAVTTLIKRQLEMSVSANDAGKVILCHYDCMNCEEDTTRAITELSGAAVNDALYVILDEAIFPERVEQGSHSKEVVEKLLARVPCLHLWTACIYHRNIPQPLEIVKFTHPLRSAPVVLQEVQKGVEKLYIHNYTHSSIPAPGDGLKVMRLYHRGVAHTNRWPVECRVCARDVSAKLRELGVGNTESSLSFRDVFILTRSSELQDDVIKNADQEASPASGFVQGLRDAGLPVCVLGQKVRKQDRAKWGKKLKDIALAEKDEVTVAAWDEVTGLERRIIVMLQGRDSVVDGERRDDYIEHRDRVHGMSRCTTQLITVNATAPPLPAALRLSCRLRSHRSSRNFTPQ